MTNKNHSIYKNIMKEHNIKLYNSIFTIQCTNCFKDMEITPDGKNTFCSLECYWTAVANHSYYDRPYKEESKIKQSKTMVDKINKGDFVAYGSKRGFSKTPNKLYGKNYRSSWEVLFHLLNIKLEYEKIRILYFNAELDRDANYITDFQDYQNKIIYEVKPKNLVSDRVVIAKENAAKIWCNKHGWEFKFITEDYFYERIEVLSDLIELIDDKDTKRRANGFYLDLHKRKRNENKKDNI